MANLADDIEAYLLRLLEDLDGAPLEVQRVEIARAFGCVPSQVTYVLTTRFSRERGFVVESRRGGGGFVRIIRLVSPELILRDILRATESGLDQRSSLSFISWLEREELITAREAAMLRAAADRETIAVRLPERDALRGRLLRAMIIALFTIDDRTPD